MTGLEWAVVVGLGYAFLGGSSSKSTTTDTKTTSTSTTTASTATKSRTQEIIDGLSALAKAGAGFYEALEEKKTG